MDYVALKTLIDDTPAVKTLYDGNDDSGAAALLNDPTEEITTIYMMTKRQLHVDFGFARTVQIIATLEGIANSEDEGAPVFKELLWLLEHQPGLDIGHPDAVIQVSALVGLNIITEEEGETVLAHGKTMVGLAEKNLGRAVNYTDIAMARQV